MYTAGKTKIGRKYSKIVYKDSNTTIPGVTEGLTGCKIEKKQPICRGCLPIQQKYQQANNSKMLQRTIHITDSLTSV